MQSLLWFLCASLLLAAGARLKMRCADIEGPIAGEAPLWVFITHRWSRGTTKRSRLLRMGMHAATWTGWAAAVQAWLLACDLV